MAGNTFGKLFTVSTFGESHGPALGCIVDGCPPGLPLSSADLQRDLDRRKPGQSRYTTQRREADEISQRIVPALFQKMFGDFYLNDRAWPVRPLGDVADVASGITKGRRTFSRALDSIGRRICGQWG